MRRGEESVQKVGLERRVKRKKYWEREKTEYERNLNYGTVKIREEKKELLGKMKEKEILKRREWRLRGKKSEQKVGLESGVKKGKIWQSGETIHIRKESAWWKGNEKSGKERGIEKSEKGRQNQVASDMTATKGLERKRKR